MPSGLGSLPLSYNLSFRPLRCPTIRHPELVEGSRCSPDLVDGEFSEIDAVDSTSAHRYAG